MKLVLLIEFFPLGLWCSTLVFSPNGDFTPVFLTLHFYPHFFKTKGEPTPRLLSAPNGVNFYTKGQVNPCCFPLSTFTDMWAQGVSAAQAGSRQAGALTQDEDAPTARSRTRDAAATARRIAAQPGEVGAGREARARRVPGRGEAHHSSGWRARRRQAAPAGGARRGSCTAREEAS